MNCLCILEINPLLVTSFEILLSHIEGRFFILFIISFAMKNILSLIRSNFFLFIFISRRRLGKDAAAIYVKKHSVHVFL